MSRSGIFVAKRMRRSSRRLPSIQMVLLLFMMLSPLFTTASDVHASSIAVARVSHHIALAAASRRFAAAAAYSISGTVFDDYNENGTQDNTSSLVEPGINGVVVTAYNAAGTAVTSATSSTVSGVLGQYTLSIPSGTGPVRVQFSNFGSTSTITDLQGLYQSNHVGGTSVQFVDGTQTTNTVSLSLEQPSEYCQSQPTLATNCYVIGDQTTTGQHVLVSFPTSAIGTSTAPSALANSTDIGSTWGLAYRRSSDSLFAASYFKRHAGFKPGGNPGNIYLISSASSCSPSCTPTLFTTLSAGTDAHNTSNYNQDYTAYDQVGKISLGGMAISDDEKTLYVMNLYDKKLYSIATGSPPAAPVAGTATSTAVPVPPNGSPCSATSSTTSYADLRPFAVTFYHGLVYVGAVCSAETTTTSSSLGDPTQLMAYVFVYTPGTGFTSTPVFQTSLNYPRHCVVNNFAGCTNPGTPGTASMNVGVPAAWNPWHTGFVGYQDLGNNSSEVNISYPEPMLSSLAFDHGDLILGLRDRYGDQMGYQQPEPPPGSKTSVNGATAGDMLRACLTTPGTFAQHWTLESNAACGTTPGGTVIQTAGKNMDTTTTTAPVNYGPGTGAGEGLYYYQNTWYPYHDYLPTGGVVQIPGVPYVATTVFDPTLSYPWGFNTGGIQIDNNVTGALANGSASTSSYQVYSTSASTFGKANGLGDLVAFCRSAPLEIGNRVWQDTNGNGIQDAGEPGIAGVTVDLYASNGTTLLQTTTTDATGNYYFTIAAASSYNSYVVKLDHASDYTTGALTGFSLSTANKDTSHLTDSKAVLPTPASAIGTNNYPQVAVGSHAPGQNDATFDIGLIPPSAPDLILAKTISAATTYQVGKSITYTLTPSNRSGAPTVLVSDPITITDTIPAGLTALTASAVTSSDWTVSLAGTISPTTLSATYKGAYPIASGATLSAITITGTLTTAALDTNSSLAGYWAFNENSGTSAYDYSSNHNTGTLTGSPTWVPGAVNSALSFNGSSNYVTMGNLSALQFGTGSFTALASFKTTSTGGFTRLFNQGVGSWNGGFNMGMNAFCSGCLSTTIGGGGSGTTSTVVGTSTNLADGKWHQAAMVIDGTAKTVQFYVDGVAQTISVQGSTCGTSPTTTTVSISSCSSLTANTTDPFIVGAYNGTSGTLQYFNGSLDEVRVYGSALSSSQIQNLYTAASLSNTATLTTPNDSNTANNTATSTITVVPQPDLTLAKTAALATPNLAINKTVTSNNSLENSDWGVAHLVDGITTSISGAKGYTSNTFSTSDASSSPPYVDIDLGANQLFNSVKLYPRTDTPAVGGGTADFPVTFTIQVEPNGSSTYTTVETVTNQANPNGSVQTYVFPTTTARHVRVVVTTLGTPPSDETTLYRFQLAEMQVAFTN